MPLPNPRNKESYSEFMTRCVLDLSKKEEFKDNKQRAAVCYKQFEKGESKASVVYYNPWDESDKILFFSDSNHCGDDKKSKGADDPMKHYFKTEKEALEDAKKLGLKGIHSHKMKDGTVMYMAGPNHEAFMKRHDEVLKQKKSDSESSLWENIRKKRERIKSGSGEKMRKKGEKGAPTSEQIKKAKK